MSDPAADVFPVGRPAGPQDVVDREAFLADLVQRLSDGQSVMLAAPRRTGKSSVAREALRRIRDVGGYTAAIDLFYVTSLEEFGAKLMHGVLQNRTGVQGQAVRALKGLREWLGHAELRAKLHDLELGVALPTESPDPVALLEQAVQAAERLAERDGRRCVVLLDEFAEVERLGGEALLKRLRALFQQQRHTAYLFLGSQTAMMRTLFSDRRQAFYRFATPLPLPDVPADAWRDYIRARMAEQELHITEPALGLLLERTGGHPYCVMAVAYNAYVQARTARLREVSADDVHFAYERTLQLLAGIYEMQWQEMHRIKHADRVLSAVIDAQAPYSLDLNDATVTKALRYLETLSLIRRGPKRGQYRVVEPMFGEWYRRKA